MTQTEQGNAVGRKAAKIRVRVRAVKAAIRKINNMTYATAAGNETGETKMTKNARPSSGGLSRADAHMAVEVGTVVN